MPARHPARSMPEQKYTFSDKEKDILVDALKAECETMFAEWQNMEDGPRRLELTHRMVDCGVILNRFLHELDDLNYNLVEGVSFPGWFRSRG